MKDGRSKEEIHSFIISHGGYKGLYSCQNAEIVYNATLNFCIKFSDRPSGEYDKLLEAARSCKQHLVEGFMVSTTSRKLEIQLTEKARDNLGKLLGYYRSFLRNHKLMLWDENSKFAKTVRRLSEGENVSYETYRDYIEFRTPKIAANVIICLIHQTDHLIDTQLKCLNEILCSIGD